MLAFPQFATQRLSVRHVQPADAPIVQQYYLHNRKHLARWEPAKPKDFYTLEVTRARIATMQDNFINDRGVHFIALADDKTQAIGMCNFTSITRGVFQACYLGFSLAEEYQGKGVMREFLQPCIHYMFTHKRLHRIMANHLPDNTRSAKLLHSLGFTREGYAKSFLKIDGRWQDHVLRAKVNELTD